MEDNPLKPPQKMYSSSLLVPQQCLCDLICWLLSSLFPMLWKVGQPEAVGFPSATIPLVLRIQPSVNAKSFFAASPQSGAFGAPSWMVAEDLLVLGRGETFPLNQLRGETFPLKQFQPSSPYSSISCCSVSFHIMGLSRYGFLCKVMAVGI